MRGDRQMSTEAHRLSAACRVLCRAAVRQIFSSPRRRPPVAAFLLLAVLVASSSTMAGVESASVVASDRREPGRGDARTGAVVTRDCVPVPHDTLWLRLNLEPQLPPAHTVDDAARRESPTQQLPPSAESDKNAGSSASPPSSSQPRRRRPRRQTAVASPPLNDSEQAEVAESDRTASSQSRRLRTDDHRPQRRRKPSSGDDRPPKPTRRRKAEIASSLATGEAWQCHMETFWERMPDGTFPPYVQNGRCVQKRCMAGLFECRPRKYATRVLRRVDGRCNPLPLVGVTAAASAGSFEEAWVVEEYHVVVGCECSKKRASGWYDQSDAAQPVIGNV